MNNRDTKAWAVRSKVWLEFAGRPVMGAGRYAILQAIDGTGSIRGAAQKTGISYRKIWGAIRDIECATGRNMVRTQRGGARGGSAVLTDDARELMDRFQNLKDGFQKTVDARFHNIFADFF